MSQCRSCGMPIEWVYTKSGTRMPVTEAEAGNVVVETGLFGEPEARVVKPGKGTHVSHFANCPQANDWRRR